MPFLVLVLILLAAIIAAPYLWEARRVKPSSRNAPGKIARLSQGHTHYRWYGGARGPVAVCVHGLATPSEAWDEFATRIAGLGHRVLVYDLYGRGFSSNAPGRQDAAFFTRQLEDLLADQGLTEDITLIGYSMGGAIATAFAAENPHMLRRLALIAPAGIVLRDDAFHRRVRNTPVLGDWLHLALEPFRMRRDFAEDHAAPDVVRAARQRQMNRAGFFPALLSSRRGILDAPQNEEHRRVSANDVPLWAFWGEADQVIPVRAMGTLAQWNRLALQESIKDAGHELVYSRADELESLFRVLLREDY